jgi:hypothetical protein
MVSIVPSREEYPEAAKVTNYHWLSRVKQEQEQEGLTDSSAIARGDNN